MKSCDHDPLDTRQLRTFVTLAHMGSFTLAAKRLSLSQSAISHSLKALERDVGCRLFDRLGKRICLTQAGEQLLYQSEKILQEMASARASLEHLGTWGCQRLRLGASATACQYILPPVLRDLKKAYPTCLLAIEPSDTPTALQWVQTRRVDLAITLQPNQMDGLSFLPLFTDELVFLLAPSHPWAEQRRVKREEVRSQNYVLYSKTSYTFRLIEDFFRHDQISLNTVIELGSMEAIKQLVKLGLGITILAPWIAQAELKRGTLIGLSLGRRKLKRQWGIVHLQHRRLSLIEETFVGLCRKLSPLESQEKLAGNDSSIEQLG